MQYFKGRGLVLERRRVTSYGEIYVALRRDDYEVLERATQILGVTKSSLVRDLLCNPIRVIEMFVDKYEKLSAKYREAVEVLSTIQSVGDGAKYIVVVSPSHYAHFFERFVSLRGLSSAFEDFVRDYLSHYSYISPAVELDFKVTVTRLDELIRGRKVALPPQSQAL